MVPVVGFLLFTRAGQRSRIPPHCGIALFFRLFRRDTVRSDELAMREQQKDGVNRFGGLIYSVE